MCTHIRHTRTHNGNYDLIELSSEPAVKWRQAARAAEVAQHNPNADGMAAAQHTTPKEQQDS